jgi:glutathione S-transferase
VILYDTQRSGNAWKVRLLAGFCGIPLQRRTLSIALGDLESPSFRDLSPFRQVPVLELDDGRHIAESMAILYFLAQGTTWWPDDVANQVQVLSWLSFEQDRHMRALARLRLHHGLKSEFASSDEELRQWQAQALAALSVMDQHLGRKTGRWIATNVEPSIADVALYPYTCMAPMGRIDLRSFPSVTDWLARVEALPGYQWLFPATPGSNFCTDENPET